MKVLRRAMSAGIVALAGCVTPDYQPPSGEDTASLTVLSNTPETFNQQVRLFRRDDCSDYPGQLVGLLHSKRVGIDTKESITSAIPAGMAITISVYAGIRGRHLGVDSPGPVRRLPWA
jgi:hypothetical protein